ncbi:MAG: DUF1540 domain-containing protein [Christensenellaceae bacterium]|jgi:hypothetical protein|nr:DUF1540 domain-containing protein [Christensenellaceae bacterium]
MDRLKCTTSNCKHNLYDHCNAKTIVISKKAACDSRIKRAGGELEQTFEELETVVESLQDAPDEVVCDFDCIYNAKRKCSAVAILVSDRIFATKCRTKIKN